MFVLTIREVMQKRYRKWKRLSHHLNQRRNQSHKEYCLSGKGDYDELTDSYGNIVGGML